MSDLAQKHCEPCEGGVPPLTPDESIALLAQIPGWQLADDGLSVWREYRFKDFV
jgi:4a-hydroxytetrahydrobiopterin dehydratase